MHTLIATFILLSLFSSFSHGMQDFLEQLPFFKKLQETKQAKNITQEDIQEFNEAHQQLINFLESPKEINESAEFKVAYNLYRTLNKVAPTPPTMQPSLEKQALLEWKRNICIEAHEHLSQPTEETIRKISQQRFNNGLLLAAGTLAGAALLTALYFDQKRSEPYLFNKTNVAWTSLGTKLIAWISALSWTFTMGRCSCKSFFGSTTENIKQDFWNQHNSLQDRLSYYGRILSVHIGECKRAQQFREQESC